MPDSDTENFLFFPIAKKNYYLFLLNSNLYNKTLLINLIVYFFFAISTASISSLASSDLDSPFLISLTKIVELLYLL